LIAIESTTPRFMSYEQGTNRIELQFCGPSTTNVAVQASTSFTIWTTISSVILTSGLGTAGDPSAPTSSQHFYRFAR
jgi:hypothetical protein